MEIVIFDPECIFVSKVELFGAEETIVHSELDFFGIKCEGVGRVELWGE